MALMNMPTNSDDGGVTIETSMSFMYRWFSKLNLLEEDEGLILINIINYVMKL